MQVCIADISSTSVTVVANAWDDALGGRDVDDLLMARFSDHFLSISRRNFTEDPKSCARMAKAVTRVRERLTLFMDATEELEDLMGDTDYRYHTTLLLIDRRFIHEICRTRDQSVLYEQIGPLWVCHTVCFISFAHTFVTVGTDARKFQAHQPYVPYVEISAKLLQCSMICPLQTTSCRDPGKDTLNPNIHADHGLVERPFHELEGPCLLIALDHWIRVLPPNEAFSVKNPAAQHCISVGSH